MEHSFVYKNDRPWPNPRLKRAAIVGHTTADSTRLWFRTAAPGDYELLLYPARADSDDSLFAGFRNVPYDTDALPVYVRRIPFTVTDYAQDSTHVVDVDGLAPLTEYRYALYGPDGGIGRVLLGQDRPYRFRTLPAEEAALSFAFYSCHMPYKHSIFGGTNVVNMAMWSCFNDVMRRHYAEDLRFVIGGGDQVYVDGVKTLDIWRYLNKVMARTDGELRPSRDEMVSWFRDIYRGYWGFPALREAFSSYPTYMIWDDHELKDGWGSDRFRRRGRDDLDRKIFPARRKKGLSRSDCRELLRRMESAGKQVYREYQHAHNPPTPEGRYDYSFLHASSAFYMLDGRGYRDVNRRSRRILGQAQLRRFTEWLEALDPARTRYLFVVSAVPVLHMKPVFVNSDDTTAAELAEIDDDLRDAWEHSLHDSERRALLAALFAAAARGLRVCILSGDVHTSAVFRMTDEDSGAVLYQLTSSAITYNKPRLLGWLLGNTVPDAGRSDDGYRFERLALYTDSNFSLLRVDPAADRVVFQLYGQQQVGHPEGTREDRPVTHSIARLELDFDG
ncbi:MAG TPA: alkaline phosphatase family protein [Gammaproteobacteria bacterium]|nr:alkaline phosphatase family protein [Gammaproteobacteria bacterium]